jgi:hypothetical protein
MLPSNHNSAEDDRNIRAVLGLIFACLDSPGRRPCRPWLASSSGHAIILTTLNIYTHGVDASHRKAVEAVEERLFGEMDCFGLKSSTAVDQPRSASAFIP